MPRRHHRAPAVSPELPECLDSEILRTGRIADDTANHMGNTRVIGQEDASKSNGDGWTPTTGTSAPSALSTTSLGAFTIY
jgi:hypothetical protein